jgi:hypothetical protein
MPTLAAVIAVIATVWRMACLIIRSNTNYQFIKNE